MGRKKRPKRVVSSFVLGLFLTLLAIYTFKGELLTNKPSFTRRELFTVQKDDVSMMLDPSEMLSPSIPPLLGDTQNAPHGAPRLAPDSVENQAPNIPTTKNDSRVISPTNQIAPPVHNTTDRPPISPVAPPPGTIQAPLNSPPSVNIPSSPRINWTPPVSSPPRNLSTHLSPSHRNNNNNNKQPVHNSSSPSPKVPVAESPKEASTSFSSSPTPVAAPRNRLSPISPSQNTGHAVSPVPTNSHLSHHNNSNKGQGPVISPAPPKAQNASSPITPPSPAPKHKQNHHASPPINHGPSISPSSPVHAPNGEHQVPSSSPVHAPNGENPVPSSSPVHAPTGEHQVPSSSPVHAPNGEDGGVPSPSPVHSSPLHHKHKRAAQVPAPAPFEPQTIQSLPPPPPNQYCTPISCPEPYTNSPPGPGSPCTCVIPIKVGVRLSVSLYTFFSLVSSLAQEIAAGVKLKQIQVRVMGANSATGDSDKTDVLIDLVPLGERFDNITALLIFDKFWRKQVVINTNYFGDYQVLYVLYPGLPPSPPAGPLNNTNNNNGLPAHPFAADVRKKDREKQKRSIIAIIVLSSVFALILFFGASWFVILKLRRKFDLPSRVPITPSSKQSIGGTPRAQYLSPKPPSMISNPQNDAPYKLQNGTTFTLAEISDATNNFDESKLIGEGGFGRVFEGVLGDAKRIAVKVLKRDDGKEFFAEVEMLGRLHHRNLVKLIGICVEGSLRCLVYELVPNGSVESHLYGAEKEVAPLDWDARIKIALGAARALAYLHEDSSPRVIHRDFKSSNILLEHDFTPKVSDFGLARAALGEGNDHISTRVMGTFGYVAPEYAMTGHLLVKSDVYSYGVVLLELLTGLKPVDMLRPPGQENLVTWALPLLSTQEGLNRIIDASLTGISFDSLAKVAAIASMCVQPEVDQRPFMGEVVQALKLVLNENNNDYDDECCSLNNSCNNDESLESESFGDKNDLGLFGATSASPRFGRSGSGSFRMGPGSGPLRTGRSCRYDF